MTIQSNRSLGGIGAILTIVGAIGSAVSVLQLAYPVGNLSVLNIGILAISSVVSVVAFVGFILFLVAMYGFSKDYGERRIFSYILYGLIIAIVLAVVIGVIWFAFFMVNMLMVIPILSPTPSSTTQIQTLLAPYYGPLLAAMSIVMLVWILYNYKAFNLLAHKSGVHLFHNAARIFLLGAVINVAVGVIFAVLGVTGFLGYNTLLLASVPGGAVMYIAWAFAAKGFYSIVAPPTQPLTQSIVSPTSYQVKYCPNCSAQNRVDSSFCERCGQKLPST